MLSKKNILFIFYLFACLSFSISDMYAKDGQVGEIKIRGRLVAEPCTLRPGDELITVDFKEIVDKYLYRNIESPAEYFDIHLDNCDNSLFKNISVIFYGNEKHENDEILETDSGSVYGIGIGIYNLSGQPVKLNKKTGVRKFENGTNILGFYARVIADADAVVNKNIGLGVFSATVIFTLVYD